MEEGTVMSTILHMSFRVKDPERSAALYAELLDGTLTDPGPVLRPVGVKAVTFGRGGHDPLADYLEFWPQDKHWREGNFTTSDPQRHQPFGHVAFETDKSYEELAAVAQKHGAVIRREERGPFGQIPVIYDYEGNFLEFFPAAKA
jgi:catechol 2,3-dioxygenase-like lactoylglutathione lyase family enzyme